MPGYSWVSIQREISKSALSCWYDRAGYGWSDPGPFPRTSVTAANDLHALLGVAHVGPPYVLVGHSLGGFNVRVYAGLYPDEVVGVVLVDPSHEDVDARIPRGRALLHMPSQLRPAFRMLILTSKRIGLLRLLGRRHESDHPPAGMTPTEWATIQGLAAMPNTTEASMEGENSAEQARAAGDLGNRPLVVLTAGTPTRVRSETIAEAEEDQNTWIQLQAQLARLSTRGRQVIVKNSGHMIPFEAPDEIVQAVQDVLADIKRSDLHRPR